MTRGQVVTRRSFLERSAGLAAVGAVTGLPSAVAAKPTERTGRIIGCYTSVKDILGDPAYIDALADRLGVNTLLVGSSITMPGWLREMNPLAGENAMFANHVDDDSDLRRAIEETRKRGMKFWLYFSGHHNSADEREVMAETFDGIKYADLPPIKYALSQGEMTTCFQKKSVRDYVQQLFAYAPSHYDVDSMYVSHARYATPSFWTNLLGCACPECREAAYDEGYDFEAMARSVKRLIATIRTLDRQTLERVAASGMTLGDFVATLGEDGGALDWLYFRSSIVGKALRRMHDAAHSATGDRCGFVTDTHNPTMSLWVGHNYEDLATGASDGLHPLSWCAYQHISVVAAWANQLCRWVDGLSETTALRMVMNFFGWDGLGFPDGNIDDLRIGASSKEHVLFGDASQSFYGYFNPDLTVKLMTHEWGKLAALNRGRVPAHPVMKGREWPVKVCRTLMERIDDFGLDGYVFQGTDNFIERKGS